MKTWQPYCDAMAVGTFGEHTLSRLSAIQSVDMMQTKDRKMRSSGDLVNPSGADLSDVDETLGRMWQKIGTLYDLIGQLQKDLHEVTMRLHRVEFGSGG
jgi:hypothetical protein